MPQAVIRAPESTENVPAARQVRDVSGTIEYLDPDATPLTTITQKLRSKVTTNRKFEWFEGDNPSQWDQVNNGAGYNNAATSIVVDNATYFSIADVINVPRTGEKMLVTAVTTGTNTLDVTRGVGSTAAAALVDNDDLQILGNAYAEGSLSGAEKSITETNPYNYTQIFRLPLGVTGTEMSQENYTGPDRDRLRARKAIEHRLHLEMTALFGERNINTGSTANPRRYTGGLFYYLSGATNTTDAGGVLSEPEIELWLESVFQHTGSGDSRLLIASPRLITALDLIASSKVQLVPRDQMLGMQVRQWQTSHGVLNVVKHRLLLNGPGGQGYNGYGLALDMDKVRFRFMRDRNMQLREDIQAPDLDGIKDEYLTEGGWQVLNPLLHGILKGVQG